jgi:malate dehydrogenase
MHSIRGGAAQLTMISASLSSASYSSASYHPAKVAIIGAGKVGSTLAQRIVEKNIADVVLLDIIEGWPQGICLDLMQARGIEAHDRKIVGTTEYSDTAGSDVIVIAAGIPRKPGMSRDDLLAINGKIAMTAARSAIAYSPDATIIVISNPLDAIAYLAWQASGLPPERVMGMAGILDSARFQTFIAMELGVSIADVSAMVIGNHGDMMVPLPRYSTVSGIPITELMDAPTIARLVERTKNGGAEIVQMLKTGGAYFAPASSTSLMIEAILFNQSRLVPVSAYLQGEYGLKDIYIGVPCRLGAEGVESIIELNLTDAEREAFQASAQSVYQNIHSATQVLATV